MSFSAETKDELARIETDKRCCNLAELAALVRMDGTLQIANSSYVLSVTTESAPVARKVYRLAKNLLELPVDIMVRRKLRLKKHNSYTVKIYPKALTDFQELGLIDAKGEILPGIPGFLVKRKCDRIAYLRGAGFPL